MAKRAIGIDMGPCHFRAVQMVRDGDRFVLEKVFTAPMRRSTDQPSDALRALVSHHGFDWRADVAAAMAPGSVFYRDLTVQAQVLEQIRQGDVTALAEHLPIPTEQMVARVCSQRPVPPDRYSVVVAATTKAAVNDRLDLLAHAHPKRVDAEAFAVCNAVLANHPQAGEGRVVVASSDADHLTVVLLQEGLVLLVRSIPWNAGAEQDSPALVADSIRLSFQKVFGCRIEGEGAVYLAARQSQALAKTLQQGLGCPVTAVDPFARVVGPADQARPDEILLAEGLAIGVLVPRQAHGVDFLATDGPAKHSKASLRRELALCGTLVCAIGMAWLIGMWTQVSCLESQHNRIEAQMTDLCRQALPDERHIVSPLAQVQQRLDRFQRDCRTVADLQRTDAGPLAVLDEIGATRQGLADATVQDLLITADQVQVQGSCRSFEQVYQWQRRLEAVPGFAKVQVEQPTRDPHNGQVSFTILIALAKEGDHGRP